MRRPKLKKADQVLVSMAADKAMDDVLPHLHRIENLLFADVFPYITPDLKLAVAWEVLDRIGQELWMEIDLKVGPDGLLRDI